MKKRLNKIRLLLILLSIVVLGVIFFSLFKVDFVKSTLISKEVKLNAINQKVESLDGFLLIGDSITRNLELSGKLNDQQCIYRAVPGATVWQWRGYFATVNGLATSGDVSGGGVTYTPSDVPSVEEVKGVIIMLGINQIDGTADMTRTLELIHMKYPDVDIYVQRVLPIDPSKISDRTNEQVDAYNATVKSFCDSNDYLTYIDTSDGYIENGILVGTSDGLHPNDYTALANNIKKKIINSSTPTGQKNIFVATNGNDSNEGTKDSPYATLNKAVESASEGAVINIRGGIYKIDSTINFDSQDKNITIQAYEDEKVIFKGSETLNYSNFIALDSETKNRIIDQDAREKVVCIDMSDQTEIDFSNLSDPHAFALYGQTRPLTIARYPNEGYVRTGEVLEKNASNFKISLDEVKNRDYSNANNIWAFGYFENDWWHDYVGVNVDNSAGTVTSKTAISKEITQNRRMYLFNLLEEIDTPGEWYLDSENKKLYIYPNDEIKTSGSVEYSVYNQPFMNLEAASDITIKNITFKNGIGKGITGKNTERVTIENCEFYNISDTVIDLRFSKESLIKSNYIHDIGAEAIITAGYSRKKLIAGNDVIENNKIERFSQIQTTYSPAICISEAGETVRHNDISDSPHMAIQFYGNNHIIEYNAIHNVCNDTNDSGAIYAGRDWTFRGNVIRYNYFYDMKLQEDCPTNEGHPDWQVHAVYLDDCLSSADVYGNIFYNVASASLMGGGRYNKFRNNIMIDCGAALSFDARGTTWFNTGEGSEIRNNLAAVDYQGEIWKEAYPELYNILNDEPEKPKYNVIKNNISYNTKSNSIAQIVSQYGEVEDNITVTSTDIFNNYSEKDFSLNLEKVNEVAEKFEDIPFKKIGLYTTISTPEEVSVTGVNINLTTATLQEGETLNLVAEVEPSNATNKGVNWQSSDTEIVEVDDEGKVTAIKEGEATITVTTIDGGKKATCKITVKKGLNFGKKAEWEDIEKGIAKITLSQKGEVIEGVKDNITIQDKISEYYEYYEDSTHKPSPTPSLLPSNSEDKKTIEWTESEMDSSEKNYSFYVKIKEEYAPGTRETNESASLKYTNLEGKEITLNVETPKLSIGKYRIEYYKQNQDKTWDKTSAEYTSGYGEIGKNVTAKEKTYSGYTLDKTVEGTILSGELNTNEEVVLKLYYTLNTEKVPYIVEYFYGGIKKYTETKAAEEGEIINTYEPREKEGYELDKVEGIPLKISADESKNVIKVYYVKKEIEGGFEKEEEKVNQGGTNNNNIDNTVNKNNNVNIVNKNNNLNANLKEDSTTSKMTLPKTGNDKILFLIIGALLLIAGFTGYKYWTLKKI